MTFDEILAQTLDLLQRQGRVSYRALKRRFALDDDYLEDLKAKLIDAQRVAADEDGKVLVWSGGSGTAPGADNNHKRAPLSYTPTHLVEKILNSREALEGERKQVTVLFADLKGSMELLADRDPEEARRLLDPVLDLLIEAVHRYEGTVNQVLGDGIMALFGAPLAHEDHATRACYAAVWMQDAIGRYAEELRRRQGLDVQIRVGLNAGEVVVRSIGNDLLKTYFQIADRDETRTIRVKVTGHVLTLDEALRDTIPALLALLEALSKEDPFQSLDPSQRRRRTLDALKRLLLRESQVQPMLAVFENLHWIDSETQAFLNSLIDVLCCCSLSVPPGGAGNPRARRGTDGAVDRAGVCATVGSGQYLTRLDDGRAGAGRGGDCADAPERGSVRGHGGRSRTVVTPGSTGGGVSERRPGRGRATRARGGTRCRG